MPKKKRVARPRAPVAQTDADLLRAFLEHIPAAVYFKDRQSRFVRISRSQAQWFGLKDPAEAINKTDFDIFSEEHAKQAFHDEQEIIRTGKPVIAKEERETWNDGRETWVLTTKLPLMDDCGRVIGTMGISQDITARKRAELELERYRSRLEELVEERTEQLQRLNQQLEQDIAARKLAEQALAEKAQQLAHTNEVLENLYLLDDLTGLYNRKGFLALVEHRLKLAHRSREPFAIAFVDLDGLKQINDALGHEEGDRALKDTANVLRDCFRESDVIARLGGDEFAVFIGEAEVEKIATRIEEKLGEYRSASERRYVLSFSVGITTGSSAEDANLEALLKRADLLMYEQKRQKQDRPLAQESRADTWLPKSAPLKDRSF